MATTLPISRLEVVAGKRFKAKPSPASPALASAPGLGVLPRPCPGGGSSARGHRCRTPALPEATRDTQPVASLSAVPAAGVLHVPVVRGRHVGSPGSAAAGCMTATATRGTTPHLKTATAQPGLRGGS